jgi:DNA-directed RNA polymerase subunit omega
MARVTVEDCLEQVENRFALVLLAAQRTRQLMKGEEALLDNKDDNKEAVTALREIAAGLVSLDDMSRLRSENARADAEERSALAENQAAARAEALARLQAAAALNAEARIDAEKSALLADPEGEGEEDAAAAAN